MPAAANRPQQDMALRGAAVEDRGAPLHAEDVTPVAARREVAEAVERMSHFVAAIAQSDNHNTTVDDPADLVGQLRVEVGEKDRLLIRRARQHDRIRLPAVLSLA